MFDPAAAATITQLAVWVVRYCRQLWGAVAGKYGETEAGQVLGYHFGEVCQVCHNKGVCGRLTLWRWGHLGISRQEEQSLSSVLQFGE